MSSFCLKGTPTGNQWAQLIEVGLCSAWRPLKNTLLELKIVSEVVWGVREQQREVSSNLLQSWAVLALTCEGRGKQTHQRQLLWEFICNRAWGARGCKRISSDVRKTPNRSTAKPNKRIIVFLTLAKPFPKLSEKLQLSIMAVMISKHNDIWFISKPWRTFPVYHVFTVMNSASSIIPSLESPISQA